MEEGDASIKAGLRRSKRNKYHLNVLDVLKSGTSSHRDYSPPTTSKRWATRRPEPTSIASIQQPKSFSVKRNARKEESVTTIESNGLKAGGNEEKEVLEEKGQEETQKAQNAEHQTSFEGNINHLDVQLPDQFLEEDIYALATSKVPKNVEADRISEVDEPRAGTSVSLDQSVDGQLKRKRKVPLRHLDYTNDEDSDMDEDKIFKSAKVEYTITDGSKPDDEHSCPKCPAIFETRVGLTNHLKLHGAKKDFPCELCDFSCTNKKTMRQHRRVHGLSRRQQGKIQQKGKSHSQMKVTKEKVEAKSTNFIDTESIGLDREPKRETLQKEEEEFDETFVVIRSLDDIGSLENTHSDLAEEMPKLEEQLTVSNKVEEDGSAKRSGNKEIEGGGALPAGHYKKGSKIYDRNKVQCPHCPFRTQSKIRLGPHMVGHKRSHGFICSVCKFASESSSFLRRHCQLHGRTFKWPPDYLSIPLKTNDELEITTESCEADVRRLANFNSEGKAAEEKCREGECPFMSRTKSAIFSHRWSHHREQYFPNLKQKKIVEIYKFSCLQCALIIRSGPAGLILHKWRRCHGRMAKARRALYGELLKERLAWKSGGEECNSLINQTDTTLESPEKVVTEAETSTKIFHCRNCPYTTDQIFRLQKHENKHLVKAEHQCSFCTFSCRSTDILGQHMRLHDNILPTSSNQLCNEKSIISTSINQTASSSESTSILENQTLKLAPIRRNETHYCPYCPYKSKHNCDMKAHLKMHEERRKFACNHCTYSTKRQNALIVHEKLHQIGIVAKGECRKVNNVFIRGKMDRTILGERMELLTNGTRFYRCATEKCSAEFTFCSELFRHARHHMKNEWTAQKCFECSICGFKTSIEKRLRTHESIHRRGDEEKNIRSVLGVFHCKGCPYATANYARFWSHRQKHKRSAKFSCSHCSFSSGSSQCYTEHLQLHTADSDKGVGSPTLPLPPKEDSSGQEGPKPTFTRQKKELPIFKREKYDQMSNALPMSQMKILGTFGKAVKDPDPGSLSSSSSSSLRTTKIKSCTECPFKTNDSVLLKLHSEMHRPGSTRPYSCNLCSFSCFSAESLHSHLSLHAKANLDSREESFNLSVMQKNTPHYQCSQCNFKCLELDSFMAHRKEHVQLLQQRLMTIIKRSGNENSNVGSSGLKDKNKYMRGMKGDKQHYCSKCSFHCDSVQAFTLHWEHHQDKERRIGLFQCSVCDYSSDTKNVVLFHEKNHHLELPLTSISQAVHKK